MLLLYYLGRGGEYPESILALSRIWRLACLEECPEELRPSHGCTLLAPLSGQRSSGGVTFVGMLSGEFSDRVAHLASHRGIRLLGEAAEELCAYGVALGGVEGQEEVCSLSRGCFPRLGGLAPEDNSGEGSRLQRAGRVSQQTRVLGRWGRIHTDVSWASSICSERPMSRTSGRCATHSSFNCCSAAVRCTLSGDWRPCSRLASAVCTSAGRTDIAGRWVVRWCGRGR